jgi:hypothetical protein
VGRKVWEGSKKRGENKGVAREKPKYPRNRTVKTGNISFNEAIATM